VAACRRILVIESNADAGVALCELLDVWGHNAILAGTGRQAIREALHGSPDVVIIDLGLEDMDGCKLVQLVRAEPTGRPPVIIAYSGSAHREAQALNAGCDVFVLKPAVDELESLVCLDRAGVRQYAATAGSAAARHR
jgi:CheY-like chemotaxis protein